MNQVLGAEAGGAAAYWDLWSGVSIAFVRADQVRVPDHWRTFGKRASPLSGCPRLAGNPANALLNYVYAILQAEARIACLVVGLDPGLGIFHADEQGRDSMALDLMEAVRPEVDAYVLDLLTSHAFRTADFHETRQGVCRLLAPLTHLLAETAPTWAVNLAPVARRVARMLEDDVLRSANRRIAPGESGRPPYGTGPTPRPARLPPACRVCGVGVEASDRSLCDDCLRRERVAVVLAAAGVPTEEVGRAGSPAHDGSSLQSRQANRSAPLPGDLLSVLSTVRDERRARQEAAALLAQLTPRQTQILRALVSGRSTAQIAEALLISEHSARAHVKHILAKLGVHSKLQAVALALGQHFA